MRTDRPHPSNAGEVCPQHAGGCLCGAVRYAVSAPLRALTRCHCSQCRKAHGAAFVTWGSVPIDMFEITQGEDALARRESSPGVTRSFCSQCGSPLTWHRSTGEFSGWISIALETLDTPLGPREMRDVHRPSSVAPSPASETRPSDAQ